ncbi:MAG: formylglycine-generating enzyme family protein [Acidimicrobiales bacterium]
MPAPDQVAIPGGEFAMGSELEPEERPVHRVRVDPFLMDVTAVTNAQYRAFVDATGYVTVAERPLDPADYPGAIPELLVPGSQVFVGTPGPVDLRDLLQWWAWVPGACWHAPAGPGSSIEGLDDHPVVHVAHEDALAWATWAGRDLPTEAEWERAARGGLEGATFAWGDEAEPDGRRLAKWFEGDFPHRNAPRDGFEATVPVGSLPPNGYGLHEITGNTWEWVSDWWSDRHPADADKPCCVPANPRGGPEARSYDRAMPQIRIPRRVIKGGSHLCADSYCRRYRPASRRPQMVDSATSHIGFRTVTRAAP